MNQDFVKPNDAKWVTIPMDVWERKYKPMEAENNDLRGRLNNNRIEIIVRVDHRYMGNHKERIGYVYLDINKGWNIEVRNWNTLEEEIMAAFRESGSGYYTKLLTAEELRVLPSHIEAQIGRLNQTMENYTEKIKKIPRFLRWLLRIKL